MINLNVTKTTPSSHLTPPHTHVKYFPSIYLLWYIVYLHTVPRNSHSELVLRSRRYTRFLKAVLGVLRSMNLLMKCVCVDGCKLSSLLQGVSSKYCTMPTMPTWLLATQRWARALISGQVLTHYPQFTLISTSPYFIVDYGRAEAQLQT